ncbi:MAG TPA: glycosyl hydrolase family 28-related protein [Xanthobacteraceae bacterium]
MVAGAIARCRDVDPPADVINAHLHGVFGDGVTDDAAAINKLIDEISTRGGGTIYFPSGAYPCRHTIHLKDHVRLLLDPGAVIKAMPSGSYDRAEPNDYDKYQDFGHSHWRNSLICGIDVSDISISGPGRISGMGLSRQEWRLADGTPSALQPGAADKIIALKNCRNVTLEDFSLEGTGHFAILATGGDKLKIRRLVIDAARDGVDLDSCWEAEVEDCLLNTPFDDGICIKASFALGKARGSKHIRVRRCTILGGFEVGTFRDGRRRPLPPGQGRKGRFKLGTESNGAFEDIVFEDCVVQDGMGLLLTSVDGGKMAGVYIRNFVAINIHNAPIFVWLGDRLRGPPGISVGAIEDINISGLRCLGYDNEQPIIISGLREHPIVGLTLSNAYLLQMGGGLKQETYIIPPAMARSYPETSLLGQQLPAQGVFARYVDDLILNNIEFDDVFPDKRPYIWLSRVNNGNIFGIKVPFKSTSPVVYAPSEIEQVGNPPEGLQPQLGRATHSLYRAHGG